jgi:hypothetical protein
VTPVAAQPTSHCLRNILRYQLTEVPIRGRRAAHPFDAADTRAEQTREGRRPEVGSFQIGESWNGSAPSRRLTPIVSPWRR